MFDFNNVDSMQEIVVSCDSSGKIREWNRAGGDITGYQREDTIGKDIGFLFPRETRKRLSRIMDYVLDGSSFPAIEVNMLISNGQKVPVDVVVYQEEKGFTFIIRDMTLKELLLKKKYEYAELYKTLVEHSSAMIYLLDTEGKLIFINTTGAKMLGYPKEEILGRQLLEFIHPDDRERIVWHVQERRKAERATWNVEIRLVPKNKKTRIFEFDYIFALLNSFGVYTQKRRKNGSSSGQEFIGTQGIARDITELKTLKQFAKNVETILPICSVCHKIRTTEEDKEKWMQIEQYINRKGGVKFSHTICPDCAKRFNTLT